MSRQDALWLCGLVIPNSQRMILTACHNFSTIWISFNTSNTHWMSWEDIFNLNITISESVLGNILIFGTNKDYSFFWFNTFHGSYTVHDIWQICFLFFIFLEAHWCIVFWLWWSPVLFIFLDDSWHCIKVENSFLSFDWEDWNLSSNRSSNDLLIIW